MLGFLFGILTHSFYSFIKFKALNQKTLKYLNQARKRIMEIELTVEKGKKLLKDLDNMRKISNN